MKQYLKYWCSPGYPGDPSNNPPVSNSHNSAAVLYYRVTALPPTKVFTHLCISTSNPHTHKLGISRYRHFYYNTIDDRTARPTEYVVDRLFGANVRSVFLRTFNPPWHNVLILHMGCKGGGYYHNFLFIQKQHA